MKLAPGLALTRFARNLGSPERASARDAFRRFGRSIRAQNRLGRLTNLRRAGSVGNVIPGR